MSDDVERRLERLERADEKMQQTLQQLVISTNRMSDLLESHGDLLPRVHKLEIDMSNANLIIAAVKWLAVAVGGSATVMVMAYLFGGV